MTLHTADPSVPEKISEVPPALPETSEPPPKGRDLEETLRSAWDASLSFISGKDRSAPGEVSETILYSAWRLHTEYNYNANRSVRRHMRLREGVIILGVIATLLAILSDMSHSRGVVSSFFSDQEFLEQALFILLVIVPITSSVILTMANKFQEGERYLALKTGAENLLRVMYLYRTVLENYPNRNQWLEERTAEIRRETLQKVKGNLALKHPPAQGRAEPVPSDTLGPDGYIKERLNYQIKRYTQKVDRTQRVRSRLQVTILALGGIGSLLAALSQMANFSAYSISIWVAFTTALAAALGSWLELHQMDWRVQRGMSSDEREKVYSIDSEKSSSRSSIDDPLESTVAIYSFMINELTAARDHCLNLEKDDRGEFYELVLLVERILWGRDFSLGSQIHTSILEEAAPSGPAGSSRPDDKSVLAALGSNGSSQAGMAQARNEEARAAPPGSLPPGPDGRSPLPEGTRVQLKPRTVVVLMPSGRKLIAGGKRIDFDHVYNRLVWPALAAEGFTVTRWMKDKPFDSIQELLLADIVVVDVGFDDLDVFYNMAIRHAFRRSGIIHIREAKLKSSFKTFNLRTTDYHCNQYGRIDLALAAADIASLQNLVSNISDANYGDNPVFNLLPDLQETEKKVLKAPSAIDFWGEDDERRERVALAQKRRRIGDILLLTDEIRNPLVKEEAFEEAGQALKAMGRHDLALTWYRRGKELNPRNLVFRREEAYSLNRLGRREEAIASLESLLDECPGDGETIVYLGRIYKDKWYDTWNDEKDLDSRSHKAYESNHWLIKSFETYLSGYRYDLNKMHPGVNAFTLGTVLVRLAERCEQEDFKDPYIRKVKEEVLPELEGALTFALETKTRSDIVDYRTLAALAELRVLTSSSTQEVRRAYHRALMGTRRTLFKMQSSLRQLEMLNLLEIQKDQVAAGIAVLKAELEPRSRPGEPGTEPLQPEPAEETKVKKNKGQPRKSKVFLFHRLREQTAGPVKDPSAAGPVMNRIPPETEDRLRAEIMRELTAHQARKNDLAIVTGMGAGSEIIFVECCTKLGIPVQVYFPEPEAEYIKHFVRPWDGHWESRFQKMRNHRLVDEYFQQGSIGAPRKGVDLFVRNLRWAEYYAQVYGEDYITVTVKEGEEVFEINFETIRNKYSRAARKQNEASAAKGTVPEEGAHPEDEQSESEAETSEEHAL